RQMKVANTPKSQAMRIGGPDWTRPPAKAAVDPQEKRFALRVRLGLEAKRLKANHSVSRPLAGGHGTAKRGKPKASQGRRPPREQYRQLHRRGERRGPSRPFIRPHAPLWLDCDPCRFHPRGRCCL